MKRLFKFVSVIILTCMIACVFVSCDSVDSMPEESKQASTTSTADETESVTEEETEEPNPLAKIVGIRLESDSGTCKFYIDAPLGNQIVSLTGVRKVLFNLNDRKEYSEVTVRYAMSLNKEVHELTHVIVVFKKDYKLTEHNKKVLEEFDMDYMFEK